MSPTQADQFGVEIPIDLSQVAADGGTQELRVVARAQDGSLTSGTVTGQAGGRASVRLTFPERPGPLQVLVGPASATEAQLVGLQTISVDVPGRAWGEDNAVAIEPILVAPFFWWWWLEWCRRFVIRGRVVCADGSPVPAATVCAYDLDWWWWWTSTEQLGCATTDINGAFEIEFTWCCGWWPWWWWRLREWRVSQDLVGLVSGVLEQDPRIKLGRSGLQPSLSVFSELNASRAVATSRLLTHSDVSAVAKLREPLSAKLPSSAELASLRIWPWWPWGPWWDCYPDVIFKVTQDCDRPGTVILEEGFGQVRVDIPQTTQVTLIANELACCRRQCPTEPCPECEGIDIADICSVPVNDVGGNLGAPPSPAGRLYPGAVTPPMPPVPYAGEPPAALYDGDRAFAGTVTVSNANIVTGVDYYEIQYLNGSVWSGLPPGAAENFSRSWLSAVPPHLSGSVAFPFTSRVVAGSSPPTNVTVVETREHYEATTGLPPFAFWTSNQFLVVPINSAIFPDDTYQFRVVGWNDAGGGEVTNGRVLPLCGSEEENGWVLTFNNRVDPDPSAIPPCGGTVPVHLCVTEPNTDIISVKVNGAEVSDCSTVDAASGTLQIDFLVQDLTGNLGFFTLDSIDGTTYPAVDLLHKPSSSLTLIGSGGDSAGPTYGEALGSGATAPAWNGGTMRLTIDAAEAFPGPCCYQIKLTAYSRTVVNCDGDIYEDYYNYSLFSIGVGVCPPIRKEIAALETGSQP